MRPLIVLIASLISMVLIFFLQTVHFETPETTGFPFILYLMLIFGFLVFMAGKEFHGAWTSGKSDIQWTSFYMLAAALVVLTGFIGLLEAFVPGWWGNIMRSRAGLIALALMLICGLGWYIMPGTGKITLAGAKWPIAILGVISLIIFLGSAIGGGTSSKKVYRDAYASAPIQAPTPVYKAPKDYSGRYKICWESLEGRKRCIFPCITARGENLSADYDYEGTRFDFTGHGGDPGKYSGEYVLTWPDGKTRTRDFSLDFEKKSGCMEVKAGVFKEVKIKKLS